MGASWEQIAQKYWLKGATTRIDPERLRAEIFEPLAANNFSTQSLIPLESLQIVEQLLWPNFSEQASNQHVILLAAFTNFKQQGNLSAWSVFTDRNNEFPSLFHRILSLNLDSSMPVAARLVLLEFVINAFQSLEQEFIRKECAPLVSIATWYNLYSDEHREKEVQKTTLRQKAWKNTQRRFNSADKDGQIKQQFERAWLYSMVLDFLRRVSSTKVPLTGETTYCERFLELLTDLISQLPTRRYTLVLLKDLNVLPVLRTSYLFARDGNELLRDLSDLFQHFAEFAVDEGTDASSSQTDTRDQHYSSLAQLQRIALQHFEPKLKVLALSNCASVDKPGELQSHLSLLSDVELEKLCQLLAFRTQYPPSAAVPTGRALFLQILVTAYARPRNFRQTISHLSTSPTEKSLYDHALLRNDVYDGSKPLATTKLNLQYLSLDDFMWRSFQLHQAEAFYEIRKDMESHVRRMKPHLSRDTKATAFEGFSKMTLPIEKPAVIEVGPAMVGTVTPSFIRAEVILDVSRLNDRLRQEWDLLRPRDTVFLLAVKGQASSRTITDGVPASDRFDSGIRYLRTAEVVQMLDDNGKPMRDQQNGHGGRSRRRRLLLNLDSQAFAADQSQMSNTKENILGQMNVIVRRQGRENNFKPVLETIQRLVGASTELPVWFQEVFLGFGNPKSASYEYLDDKIEKLDFLDTFLDWQHLQESFPTRKVASAQTTTPISPPYVLELFPTPDETVPTNSKKRRRGQMEEDIKSVSVNASTYKPPNAGPYPIDVPKKNNIRFTPKQIEAVISGTQRGLSVIVGPPGTGKTDVATQIINLLYHNFPSERILLVAHSNQALNQLFQKIIALDIDSRHLLRLGHGEEELDTEVSYSKYGRVESFMENRTGYLGEVQRLAASIGAEGAHGSTCETADYFNQVYVQPAWAKFQSITSTDSASAISIARAFPFHAFFSNAPIPDLFPPSATLDETRDIAKGCKRHLDRIFAELEAIRPFEILRSPRDQANHLLVKEARIIAMTSTHAAMRRAEIADLGFHYDTLIMEEAAQITEIESFIPCALQNPDSKTGVLPLQRIVLVGDHLQNSPVIQNLALRQYARFEQSLFLRLVRLGVPTIALDQQGRCRPSIAELFNWRYDNLTDLPHLLSHPEFGRANAGFRHEFQFIDVPDYQGQGEREPTAHFIQNLGEAEYAVALYQYMRLLGYPARSISILATYAGQKALIRDVLDHRCKGNRLFGLPRIVTTVDKYQGEQNDYVILSLVRTKSVGYLRDVRRLTVALSRARLGLYILGRRELFERCLEMKTAMDRLAAKEGDKLQLVTGEMFPTNRLVADEVEAGQVAEMDGVEHLGQYVYEMTQAKIKSLGGTLEVATNGTEEEVMDAEVAADELADELDVEEDPLHENV